MFSIPSDVGPNNVLKNKNKTISSESNHLKQKGFVPAQKKKALGDISNTLRAKKIEMPLQMKPQINVTPLKKQINKDPSAKCSSTFKIACDSPVGDVCSLCNSTTEDDYTDIRPSEDRLTDTDVTTLIQGMCGMLDSPPLTFEYNDVVSFPLCNFEEEFSVLVRWDDFDTPDLDTPDLDYCDLIEEEE